MGNHKTTGLRRSVQMKALVVCGSLLLFAPQPMPKAQACDPQQEEDSSSASDYTWKEPSGLEVGSTCPVELLWSRPDTSTTSPAVVKIYRESLTVGQDTLCAFVYKYDPGNGGAEQQIGWCPFSGGRNRFGWKEDGNNVYIGAAHKSRDTAANGSFPADDNCNGEYDWVVNIFTVGGSSTPYWRKDPSEQVSKDGWTTQGTVSAAPTAAPGHYGNCP